MAQLSQNFKKLQQQVSFLETRTPVHPSPMAPASTNSAGSAAGALPGNASRSSLQKAQQMEKELIISQSSKKAKPPSPQEQAPEMEPKPLGEIYLSFNDWIDQFLNKGINLEQLASASLKVDSKRRISFGQFGHRMEKKVEDPQQFQSVFQQFANQYADGFVPEVSQLQEQASSASEQISETAPSNPQSERPSIQQFQPPPHDMYRGFNDWLEWLKDCGIDPHEFASQDLMISSTRQISFQQFCRRLERNLDDVQSFRNALQIPG